MYLPLDDARPDTPTLESAISRREGVMLSVFIHAGVLLLLLVAPQLPWIREVSERAQQAALEREARLAEQRNARFVFVEPRVDRTAPLVRDQPDLSDKNRIAATPERRPNATNPMPFSRGNTAERVEAPPEERSARGPDRGQAPQPPQPEAARDNARQNAVELPDSVRAQNPRLTPAEGVVAAAKPPGGSLGDALRNLKKYVENQSFNNPDGGAQQIGPFQFDSKGVEFGPWIRRFIAQIKRNWFVPYAAMSFKGHVLISFNVHRDGLITDLTVVQPSSIESFNHAAFNALAASSPTQPLPPEYPADKAFFTVTFYYNEAPAEP